MSEYKKVTVVFPIREGRVILGMKKRGFGAGWWNGFGGKLEDGESFEDSAIRETREESGIVIKKLTLVARLLFYFENQLQLACLAYTTNDFNGEPAETEEMKPKLFNLDEIPYESMWPGDDKWIPQALSVNSYDEPLNFKIFFDKDNHFQRIEQVESSVVSEYFVLK